MACDYKISEKQPFFEMGLAASRPYSSNYESEGRTFESFRARHFPPSAAVSSARAAPGALARQGVRPMTECEFESGRFAPPFIQATAATSRKLTVCKAGNKACRFRR
jgi:hypothetical protein